MNIEFSIPFQPPLQFVTAFSKWDIGRDYQVQVPIIKIPVKSRSHLLISPLFWLTSMDSTNAYLANKQSHKTENATLKG